MSLPHVGIIDVGAKAKDVDDDPGPPPEVSEERLSEIAKEIAPEPKKARKRYMIEFFADVAIWAKETNQFAWDTGLDASAPVMVDPERSAKLITRRQWAEAMRVAIAVYSRPRARTLGAPEAIAHPSGRAGLGWTSGDSFFSVLLDPKSDERSGFLAEYSRKDARGESTGAIKDLRELGQAVEAALCSP